MQAIPRSLSRIISRKKLSLQLSGVPVRRIAPFATLLLALGVWQFVTTFRLVSPFIIPAPAEVAARFYEIALSGKSGQGKFWFHVWTTLQEILVGLALGVSIGFVLGYWIAKIPWLEDLLSPIIVAFQATPLVAYAPLLVIWFGTGMTSKVVVVTLIVFFPMLMNTIVGIRSVPSNLHDLLRALLATPWQTFTKLEIPAAVPALVGGFKLSATLAVIGAVVGEFVNADAGLGFLINDARYRYDTPLVIVAVLTLTILALVLYHVVTVIERRLLAWQTRVQRD